MTLPVKPSSTPVNGAAILTSIAGAATYVAWPDAGSTWQQYPLTGLFGLITASGTATMASSLIRDFRLRRELNRAMAVTDDHGSARQATWEELCQRWMHDPSSGSFIGLYADKAPVFMPPKTPFSLIEMPPGTGKTINMVTSSVLGLAKLGFSLIVPDVKLELAPMLVPALRDQGFEVWCVNPTGQYLELCGADTELNLYQAVLDALYAKGEYRKDTVKICQDLADLHLPEGKEERNKYFRNGSRRCIAFAILYKAYTDPAGCNPTSVFELLNDPRVFLGALLDARDHLQGVTEDDPILAFLKGEAAGLINRYDKNEENFSSFLEGATQVLLTFNQAGRLGYYGAGAVHNIQDVRSRQIIVFIMSPLSHTRELASFVSMLNYNVLAACKRAPTGRQVHIVGEEALNYRFSNIVSDLETMRGLKMSADLYIQSYSGLVRKYGREAAQSIDAYANVKIYAGITSFDRAKRISDMLAEATIRKQDYSYRSVASAINVSSGQMGRRLMTPDEVLAMPSDAAWVFVKGLRPFKVRMAHYGQIDPYRDWVGDNPIEGARLRGDPLFSIHYPKQED